MRKECFPEIDRLFLVRLTSSSPLKIGASRKYILVAYKLLFSWSTLNNLFLLLSWAVDDDDLLLWLTVLRPSISNLLQSVSSAIIKCDGLLLKVRQLFYSKVRQFYYKVCRWLPSAREQRESFWNLESVRIQPAEIRGKGTDFLHDYREFLSLW